jgi:hypothetical protein
VQVFGDGTIIEGVDEIQADLAGFDFEFHFSRFVELYH